ncbi:hypothetical protein GN958_ATG14682 [Phytophthora infestans]|uniref:DDE-1 domain-containing protein n=1 Tax=Phytophthora infestans TaxID=4787 RepID=A0A8S9UB03_PHYIN|nr:hypothetical protein GN958_ATG14682 [Phytophthora infestans]
MLRLKGKEVAEDLQISNFKGSWHWQQGVLRRHRLSFCARTRQGQTTPEDANATAISFGIEVQQKMLELRVHNVYNADQKGVFFEYLSKRSRNSRGSKPVGLAMVVKIKNVWRKISTIYSVQVESVNRYGWRQRNLEKRSGIDIYVWKEAKESVQTHAIKLYTNLSAWWNEDVHIEWLKTMFGSRPRPTRPVILLLDDFSGHWTSAVLDYAKSIDLHLMRSNLRSEWVSMLRQQLLAHAASTHAFRIQASNTSYALRVGYFKLGKTIKIYDH